MLNISGVKKIELEQRLEGRPGKKGGRDTKGENPTVRGNGMRGAIVSKIFGYRILFFLREGGRSTLAQIKEAA